MCVYVRVCVNLDVNEFSLTLKKHTVLLATPSKNRWLPDSTENGVWSTSGTWRNTTKPPATTEQQTRLLIVDVKLFPYLEHHLYLKPGRTIAMAILRKTLWQTSWPNLNDPKYLSFKGMLNMFFWQVIKRHVFMTSEAFAGWILQLRFLRSERWRFVVTLDQWLLESFSASGLASISRYRAWAQDFNVNVVGEDQEDEVDMRICKKWWTSWEMSPSSWMKDLPKALHAFV